jgi:hypothetical protein
MWMGALLLLLISCSKQKGGTTANNPGSIEGHVEDAVSKKNIPFATVFLAQQKDGTFGANAQQQIAYQIADNSGYFHFSFKPQDNYIYLIRVQAPNYFDGSEEGNFYTPGDPTNLTVTIKPMGWIKYQIINEPPKDTLEYFIEGNIALLSPITFLTNDTTLFSRPLASNNKYTISYLIQKKGEPEEKHILDSLFIRPLDTVTYTIKY